MVRILFLMSIMVLIAVTVTASNLELYFPTSIGDKWEYIDPTMPEAVNSLEITKDTIILAQKYLVFSEESESGSFLNWYYRVQGEKVYAYFNMLGFQVTEPIFDFDPDGPDSWIGGGGYLSISVISRDETVETPAGTFEHCYSFNFSTLGTDLNQIFAPNVGRIVFKGTSVQGNPNLYAKRWRLDGQWYPAEQSVQIFTSWSNIKSIYR